MANTKKAKAEKEPKKGRNNMVSSRKDFDSVLKEIRANEDEAFIVKSESYLTMLSDQIGLGWKPKAIEAEPTSEPTIEETTPEI